MSKYPERVDRWQTSDGELWKDLDSARTHEEGIFEAVDKKYRLIRESLPIKNLIGQGYKFNFKGHWAVYNGDNDMLLAIVHGELNNVIYAAINMDDYWMEGRVCGRIEAITVVEANDPYKGEE